MEKQGHGAPPPPHPTVFVLCVHIVTDTRQEPQRVSDMYAMNGVAYESLTLFVLEVHIGMWTALGRVFFMNHGV